MNDEDEIDVLGDFKLDILSKGDSNIYDGSSLISVNSDLLNCDYTIHPQWFLDRPSANPDNWYTNTPESLPDREDEVLSHFLSTENSITDESGWTEKEKCLLERGIEIFGKSNERLSQFIGSKLASEVKYYLKNFYSDHHNGRRSHEVLNTNINLLDDILEDKQIPISIEEVIATVSTAKPTVPTINNKSKKNRIPNSNITDKELLQSNIFHRMPNKQNTKRNKGDCVTRKGKCSTKASTVTGRKIGRKTITRLSCKKSMNLGKNNPIKLKKVQVVNEQSNENEIKTVKITTGQGLAVPICEGEEIVKIKSCQDSDTDTEIDVELSDDDPQCSVPKLPKVESDCPVIKTESPEVETESGYCKIVEQDGNIVLPNANIETAPFSEKLQRELTSLEVPKCELILDRETVTELEKVIHQDYFSGSMTKTPERYLKIRNHILKGWNSQKPNYIFKTISRQGLKNCGDVNNFGRIHNFLEQIGAINFGCSQVRYSRPLLEMLQEQISTKDKRKNEVKDLDIVPSRDLGSRPRHKPKLFNDGEGGYTLSHDEQGRVFKQTVINQEPTVKHKQYIKKPMIPLIYCRPFTEENQQPYEVNVSLSALLKMDFHAHTSLTEVMGLVAGFWVPETETLTVNYYEPCRNLASSATHCDMCPISQARAADTVHSMGYDILGWFHSHPTFAPEPSRQDLETQQFVQQWIGQDRPCVGVILSPFSSNGALIASPVRCMIVGKKQNFEDQIVPYKFNINIDSEGFVVQDCLEDLKRVQEFNLGYSQERKVDFAEPYFHDGTITFLEKFITSVHMRTAKCGTLSKTTCDELIDGVKFICSENR